MPIGKHDNRKKTFLAALEKSLGVVSTACRTVGMSRKTHYNWMARDAKYKKAVEDLENVALDFAESQIHKQISAGEVAATIFYLKCKGKKRGYIERSEITGANGQPLSMEKDIVLIPADKFTDEQIGQIMGKFSNRPGDEGLPGLVGGL